MSQPSLLSYLKQLYKEKRELTILEITYLVIAGVSFLVAAVIALLNQSLGVGLLIIPFIAFLAFSANLIVWALVKMLVEESIKGQKQDIKRDLKIEDMSSVVETEETAEIEEPKKTSRSLSAKAKQPVIKPKQTKKS